MKNIYSIIESKHFNDYGYEIIRSGLYNEYIIFEKLLAQYFSKSMTHYLSKNIELESVSNYNDIAERNQLDHHEFITTISRKLPKYFYETDFIKGLVNNCEQWINKKIKIG
jgi:hypothetical protein